MRFKPGQKVVCRKEDTWISIITGKVATGPKFNEVCTVDHYDEHTRGFVALSEFPEATAPFTGKTFNEKWFEPLADISELTELLNEVPETVSI